MIRINVLQTRSLIIGSSETLCIFLVPQSEKKVTNPFGFDSFEVESSGLTQQQLDMLMGKAPLRLVVSRVPFDSDPVTTWLETLECGHENVAYIDWYWDKGGHLIQSVPTAKRRRCTPCKELLTKKKPNESIRLPRKRRIA